MVLGQLVLRPSHRPSRGGADRAFEPFYIIMGRFGFRKHRFYPFLFFTLWISYALLSFLIRTVMIPQTIIVAPRLIHSFGEGLLLILGLFPFPGFFSLVILIGALLSWVSPDPYNPVVQAIYGISEPLLAPFRRIIPNIGGLDISPILALFCFHILGVAGQQLVAGVMRAF